MIVVRSRVAVILPEIPLGRRTSPWRIWTSEDEPSVDERILMIATKQELTRRSTTEKKQTHGKHTTHKHDMMHTQVWCMTKATRSYSWQEMMQTRATHQGKFKWGRKQHITNPVSPHMQIAKLVQIWIPYVQVVKQQVKMHQDDLHESLVKLHIKFIRFGATA